MDIPKPDYKDYLHKITKGTLGTVPFAGSILSEFFDIVITPTHQKKMEEWFSYVNDTLETIINQDMLTKEHLFADEEFTAIFQKTTRSYVQNVESYKKPLFQSLLKSSVASPIPLDKKIIFVDILDHLTEKHLHILLHLYKDQDMHPILNGDIQRHHLNIFFADGDDQYMSLLIKGLQDYHLTAYTESEIINGTPTMRLIPSKIGKEFIAYVTEDDDNE
jgi:hypothetical protein